MRRGVTTMARRGRRRRKRCKRWCARARALGTFEGAEQEELAYAPKKAVRARDASEDGATRRVTPRAWASEAR